MKHDVLTVLLASLACSALWCFFTSLPPWWRRMRWQWYRLKHGPYGTYADVEQPPEWFK